MEYQKEYSLLRPFDMEAAKRGEKICSFEGLDQWNYVDGPDCCGNLALKAKSDGRFIDPHNCHSDAFRMAPLAWVEGKPVYRGDVLCYKKGKGNVIEVSGLNLRDGGNGIEGVVIEKGGYYPVGRTTWAPFSMWKWKKPKTKREGWMNCYEDGENFVYPTKKQADNNATYNRVDCIRIEWEE